MNCAIMGLVSLSFYCTLWTPRVLLWTCSFWQFLCVCFSSKIFGVLLKLNLSLEAENHSFAKLFMQGLVTFQGTSEWKNVKVRAPDLVFVIVQGWRFQAMTILGSFFKYQSFKFPWTCTAGWVCCGQMFHLQHHGQQTLGLSEERWQLFWIMVAFSDLVRSVCKELYWDSTPGLHCEVLLVLSLDLRLDAEFDWSHFDRRLNDRDRSVMRLAGVNRLRLQVARGSAH